jgi:hypothetical protein
MDLSTPAALESLARDVAAQLDAQRTEPGDMPGRVRIVYADGRALDLAPNRPRTRLTITAVLPEQAATYGMAIEPITVSTWPQPRPSETQDKATARHIADHIRRRLLPQQHAALSRMSSAVERARTALSNLPERSEERWAIADVPVPHPHQAAERCPVAWWHTPDGESRAMAPFLADVLRRAGLVTTEPHGGGPVFFAELPTEQPDARFHVAPASGRPGWDLVDQYTGASVHTYDDTEWAQGAADSMNRTEEAARRKGVASLDLPGLSGELVETDHVRALAVELAMAGHLPYGLVDGDYEKTAGFLIYPGPQPGTVHIARLLEPWGSVRPGDRREAPDHQAARYDQDLEAYAQLLSGPGRIVVVQPDGIQVTFTAPPPSL